MLRPYTRSVKIWGIPRINAARFASLIILASGLLPIWFHRASLLPLGGASLGLIYLWWRGCWLLDQHRVTGLARTLLFPGLLGLGLALLGTLAAILLLGFLVWLDFASDMAFSYLLLATMIAAL
ncbi:MAG TPA: hypothetical protein PLA50_20010, partial [Bacteroidia bacterium]|nr:hypothetical protein [Bacteroidia bacterium]